MNCYHPLQGTRLHYVERGGRSRTMILCLHDFADFWFGWRNQLLELGDRQTCEPCLTMFDNVSQRGNYKHLSLLKATSQ